ncbi:phosphate/phosphite/phosphonate ABC transporter substrate-binding protein [Marinicella sp. W31]|uniref:phosphate/phosphite/phosphonate ABC transporter substrate-binding protein n=1 Tax=Marinicella sp. W31 TaxID=3023713 RepID=UPI0037584422
MRKQGLVIIMILGALIFSNSVSSRTFTIAIEPNYPNQQLEQMIKPLSDWLKSQTGHDLKLVPAENYYLYWKDTVLEQPDLTLDSPHITSYRIQERNYKPLVRTAEATYYHLVVDYDLHQSDPYLVENMPGKRIATLQHPSMASILYEKWYGGSAIMPAKILARYSFQDGIDLIFDAEADATIIPEKMLALYPNFVSVKKSEAVLGLTLSVAPHINDNTALAIQQALLNAKDDSNAYEALVEWNTSHFVEAQEAEYVDLVSLIPRSYMDSAREAFAAK